MSDGLEHGLYIRPQTLGDSVGIREKPPVKSRPKGAADIRETLAERGQTYGHFPSHAEISQGIKDVMHTTEGWARLANDQREALEMIAHKIGRVLNGNPDFHDSWHDIVGYTTLVADRLAGEPHE